MPGAGIGDGDHDVLAFGHGIREAEDIAAVEIGVRGLDRDLAAVGHGVARVDRQIDQGALELIGVGLGTPKPAAQHGLQRHGLAEGAGGAVRRCPATSLLGSMTSGESGCWREKASSRLVSMVARRTPSRAMSRARSMRVVASDAGSFGSWRRIMSSPPVDDGEEVVEVVGDAAGQLADGLHLLRLPQRLFRHAQSRGALFDPRFQRGVQLL